MNLYYIKPFFGKSRYYAGWFVVLLLIWGLFPRSTTAPASDQPQLIYHKNQDMIEVRSNGFLSNHLARLDIFAVNFDDGGKHKKKLITMEYVNMKPGNIPLDDGKNETRIVRVPLYGVLENLQRIWGTERITIAVLFINGGNKTYSQLWEINTQTNKLIFIKELYLDL